MNRFFPVALRLEAERVVFVDPDNEESALRISRLLATRARVEIFGEDLAPEVSRWARAGRVTWYCRPFAPSDATGARLVYLCKPGSREQSAALRAQGRREGFLLCAVDSSEDCDFANLGQVQAGPVTISIGSDGQAPALTSAIRRQLEVLFDERFEAFAQRFSKRRKAIGQAAAQNPGADYMATKKAMLDKLLEGFAIEAEVRYPGWQSEPD